MEHAHVVSRRMPAMKSVGKPDAGNPHVRFDERGGETGRESDTAPLLDSPDEICGLAIGWDGAEKSQVWLTRLL